MQSEGEAMPVLTVCWTGWTRPQVQQDSVHTGRRGSPHWPRPLSGAPDESGSCDMAALTPGWCPAALMMAQHQQEQQGWKRAHAGCPRSLCWCQQLCRDSAPEEEGSHRGKPAEGRWCNGSTACLEEEERTINIPLLLSLWTLVIIYSHQQLQHLNSRPLT